MEISYDPEKNQELLRRRGMGFEEIKSIFLKPHFVDSRRGDYLGQNYAVGLYKGQLWTVIFEDIEDDLGSLRWLVTFWPSTFNEKRRYYNA